MKIYLVFLEGWFDIFGTPVCFFHSKGEALDYVRGVKHLAVVEMTLGVSGYKIIWPEE